MITLICKECGSILYTFKSIPGGKVEETIQVPPCRECLDRQYDLGYSKCYSDQMAAMAEQIKKRGAE